MGAVNPRKLRINHPPLPTTPAAVPKYLADQKRQLDNFVLSTEDLIGKGAGGNFNGVKWTSPFNPNTFIQMNPDGTITIKGPTGSATY